MASRRFLTGHFPGEVEGPCESCGGVTRHTVEDNVLTCRWCGWLSRPRLESGSWQAFGCTDPGDMEPCAAVLCGWPHGHRVDAGTNVADVLLPRACTALDALGEPKR